MKYLIRYTYCDGKGNIISGNTIHETKYRFTTYELDLLKESLHEDCDTEFNIIIDFIFKIEE